MMSPLSFRAFLSGPDAQPLVSESRWHPLAAAGVSIAIVLTGQVVPILLFSLWHGRLSAPAGGGSALGQPSQPELMAALLAGQAAMALLTLAIAGRGGQRASALRLAAPDGSWWTIGYALALMLPLLALFNVAAYLLSPAGFRSDFQQFKALAQGPGPWITFAAIGLGAPLWEELLFRGLLLPPLAAALGFWPAAALVSAAWTGLHLSYSVAGLLEVFLIGLYLAWLLKRTGSLWVPIACHAVYNAGLFGLLRVMGA